MRILRFIAETIGIFDIKKISSINSLTIFLSAQHHNVARTKETFALFLLIKN